jgi:SAM-dependent methyltransferase
MTDDVRRVSPSVARNREAIWAVVKQHLPLSGLVLEIASGSGEHVVHFARESAPGLTFQPSDPDPTALLSIDAWVLSAGVKNVRRALQLDAASDQWPVSCADAIICINMIHIAPWAATEGLVRGAARTLSAGGVLYLYGPYRRHGAHTAPSNEAFDVDLRTRDATWGVRDLEAVTALAAQAGFEVPLIEPMPANNLSVIFRRAG